MNIISPKLTHRQIIFKSVFRINCFANVHLWCILIICIVKTSIQNSLIQQQIAQHPILHQIISRQSASTNSIKDAIKSQHIINTLKPIQRRLHHLFDHPLTQSIIEIINKRKTSPIMFIRIISIPSVQLKIRILHKIIIQAIHLIAANESSQLSKSFIQPHIFIAISIPMNHMLIFMR